MCVQVNEGTLCEDADATYAHVSEGQRSISSVILGICLSCFVETLTLHGSWPLLSRQVQVVSEPQGSTGLYAIMLSFFYMGAGSETWVLMVAWQAFFTSLVISVVSFLLFVVMVFKSILLVCCASSTLLVSLPMDHFPWFQLPPIHSNLEILDNLRNEWFLNDLPAE